MRFYFTPNSPEAERIVREFVESGKFAQLLRLTELDFCIVKKP